MQSDRRWVFSDPLDPAAGKAIIYALNLLVMRTHDLERSRRFYEAIGLRFQFIDYGHGARSMQGPVPPDAPLVLHMRTEGIPPPHTYLEIHTSSKDETISRQQIGFFVGSVDAAVTAAVEAGGTLLSKPANWPYGRRAAVADPDGHRVELSEDPFGRLTGDYPK
jgi:catechol 2,3-dioxygenase-like lactoylglutathione lyase family enzyme